MSLESERNALIMAIQLVGGVAEVATTCHCSVTAVYNWVHKGIPPARAMELEEMTGGRIARASLFEGIEMWLSRRAARDVRKGNGNSNGTRAKRY